MTRLFHRLLRSLLLPGTFRARHGEAMEEVFREALDLARTTGPGAVAALWLREAADLALSGWRFRGERKAERTRLMGTGGGMMGIRDDVGYAVRSLVRRPMFALFAALTVALGMGSATVIYSAVETVLLRPVPMEGGERLVMLWRRIGNARGFVSPDARHLDTWEEQEDVIEAIERFGRRSMTLTGNGPAREVHAALIRPGFHAFSGQEPALGRGFTDEEMAGEGARVLMLGHGLWRSRFGADPGVLGQPVTLDGEPWTVVGVMPRSARLPVFREVPMDVWRPMADDELARSPAAVALLREGVSLAQLNQRLDVLDQRAAAQEDASWRPGGEGMLLSDFLGRSYREGLRLLAVAVLLVLLVACVNVSNLLLNRANERRRETAVRVAMGSPRARLVRQHLLEAVILALVGGAMGVGLAWAGTQAVPLVRPDRLSALDGLRLDARVLGVSFGLAAVAGILFGLLPAIQGSRPGALATLRSGAREEGTGADGARVRWLLLAGEVALSFALLVGSAAAFASLARLQRTDPGFRAGEVAAITLDLPEWIYGESERTALFDALAARYRSLGGVHVAQASSMPPFAGVTFGTVEVEGEEPGTDTHILRGPAVREGYFATLGQPVLQGRGFTADEVRDRAEVYVLGEGTARRFFPGGDAVGRRMRLASDGPWYTVVGVVEDVAINGLSGMAELPLQLYQSLEGRADNQTFLIRVETGRDPATLLPLMRELAIEMEPDAVVTRLGTAESFLSDTLAQERFTSLLLAGFAMMALVLSAVGLYGVVTQLVGQRTREIGIRIALGAHPGAIRLMVLTRSAGATVVGIAAGALLAMQGLKALSSTVFGLDKAGAPAYLVAAAALAATALLASWMPARRATRIDPTEAMRSE